MIEKGAVAVVFVEGPIRLPGIDEPAAKVFRHLRQVLVCKLFWYDQFSRTKVSQVVEHGSPGLWALLLAEPELPGRYIQKRSSNRSLHLQKTGHIVVFGGIEHTFLNGHPRRHNTSHFTPDQALRLFRILGLIANGDLVPLLQ